MQRPSPAIFPTAISLVVSLTLMAMSHARADERQPSAHKPAQSTSKIAEAKGAGKKPSDQPASGKSASENVAYQGKPVLEPSQFAGLAGMGYACAKAAPEVMSKLFCYCGCDSTDNHSSLVDCYTSLHGVDCHICQEEAVMALRLHREGMPIAEIQKRIDQEYSHYYPFEHDTDNYKKYKASRLWKASDSSPAAPDSTSGSQTGKSDTATTDNGKGKQPDAKPKVKPGYHVGNCCKGDHK